MLPLRIGAFAPSAPVVLAPMAGVTNAPFRAMCRTYAPDLLYVSDDAAKLFCLDAKTGNKLWDFEYGKNTKGSPVWADGKIYVSEVDSKFHILKPAREGCKRLHQHLFRTKSFAPVELHGAPAVVNGRLFIPTVSGTLYVV